jgi:hypothetical protein
MPNSPQSVIKIGSFASSYDAELGPCSVCYEPTLELGHHSSRMETSRQGDTVDVAATREQKQVSLMSKPDSLLDRRLHRHTVRSSDYGTTNSHIAWLSRYNRNFPQERLDIE